MQARMGKQRKENDWQVERKKHDSAPMIEKQDKKRREVAILKNEKKVILSKSIRYAPVVFGVVPLASEQGR
jgi:hypothetical protein